MEKVLSFACNYCVITWPGPPIGFEHQTWASQFTNSQVATINVTVVRVKSDAGTDRLQGVCIHSPKMRVETINCGQVAIRPGKFAGTGVHLTPGRRLLTLQRRRVSAWQQKVGRSFSPSDCGCAKCRASLFSSSFSSSSRFDTSLHQPSSVCGETAERGYN